MTLCGVRRRAGWSFRHNVKPRTPDGGPDLADPGRSPFRFWVRILLLPLSLFLFFHENSGGLVFGLVMLIR